MSLVNDMLNDLEQRQRPGDSKAPLDVVPVGRGAGVEKSGWQLPLFVIALISVLSVVAYQYWPATDVVIKDIVKPLSEAEAIVGEIPTSSSVPIPLQENKIRILEVKSHSDDDGFNLDFISEDLKYQISPVDETHLKIVIHNVSWAPARLSLPDWLAEIHMAENSDPQGNSGVEITLKANKPFSYQAQIEVLEEKRKLSLLLKMLVAKTEKTSPVKVVENVAKQADPKKTSRAAIRTPRPLTPAQLDRKLSLEAQQLIHKGHYQQAEQKLWPIVDGYAAAIDSRVTLVTLLLGQQRYALAQQQLKQGLQSHPQDRRLLKLSARLAMAQGRLEDARDSLAPLPINLSVDSEQVELLAVIYQRLGNNQQALQLYHQLVLFDANQPQWWVGLGVSMEALGQSDSARAAYLRASRMPVANAAIKQHISQRLAALSVDGKQ